MADQLDLSGCRQAEDTLISYIRRHRKHFGSRTGESLHGGSRDGCNGTRHRAIAHFCME